MILKNKRSLRISIGIYLIAVLLATVVGSAMAQDSPPAAAGEEVTADEVNLVARELWCPLCSGVRLDACELKACDQMKEVIAIKLAEGEDTESIKDYFVVQYGPQVLGEPPREGFNWLAWVLPFVALAIGGVFLWRQMNRMMRPAEQDAMAATSTAPESMTSPEAAAARAEDRKLDEELTKYG